MVRKERGVYLSPSQTVANLNAGQLDAVEEWFALYGQNQILHDAIAPFKVYQPFTSDTNGYVAFKDNYIHLIGNPFTVYGSTVRILKFVGEDELAFALTSQLRPISQSDPVAIGTSDGFLIYPQTTQQGMYWYLRRPLDMVYGYTQVGRVITYDPSTSVQPEFLDVYMNHIIAKALLYAGINMGEAEIVQFANQYNQQTQ